MIGSDRLKIGILWRTDAHWGAILSYQLNLLQALEQYASSSEDICLLMSRQVKGLPENNHRAFTRYYLSEHNRVLTQTNRVARRMTGYDLLLARDLSKVPGGVDIIFPGYYRVDRSTALVFWIPDFQHLHLPEMFSSAEIRDRNRLVIRGAERATSIVLSSRDALKDFEMAAPRYAHKGRVMNFVSWVSPSIYKIEPGALAPQYELPAKFIYLPNQFWKHKNHGSVWKALKILKEKGVRPHVVCTGLASDYRHPTYFAELMQRATDWRLEDQITVLGLVPLTHVHMLIRQCVCVLNPSWFEGWSTTVEEAKTIGKRCLLSDLPVHREQDPPKAVYFDPRSPDELAAKMAEVWRETFPGPDLELELNARGQLPDRMRDYARTFVSIARQAKEAASGCHR
jgi:glycosyltransferase involved in cell wall biosynthesis